MHIQYLRHLLIHFSEINMGNAIAYFVMYQSKMYTVEHTLFLIKVRITKIGLNLGT